MRKSKRKSKTQDLSIISGTIASENQLEIPLFFFFFYFFLSI